MSTIAIKVAPALVKSNPSDEGTLKGLLELLWTLTHEVFDGSSRAHFGNLHQFIGCAQSGNSRGIHVSPHNSPLAGVKPPADVADRHPDWRGFHYTLGNHARLIFLLNIRQRKVVFYDVREVVTHNGGGDRGQQAWSSAEMANSFKILDSFSTLPDADAFFNPVKEPAPTAAAAAAAPAAAKKLIEAVPIRRDLSSRVVLQRDDFDQPKPTKSPAARWQDATATVTVTTADGW